jgi:hypothetical protein
MNEIPANPSVDLSGKQHGYRSPRKGKRHA